MTSNIHIQSNRACRKKRDYFQIIQMLRPMIRAPCERNVIINTICALNRFVTTTFKALLFNRKFNYKKFFEIEMMKLLEFGNVKIDTSNVKSENTPKKYCELNKIDFN